MMKNKLACALALLLTLTALTACGASSGGSTPASSATAAAGEYPMEMMDAAGNSMTANSGTSETQTTGGEKKIYTASLELETTAFDDAAAGLSQLVTQSGGWIENSSVNYVGDRYRYGSYTVRVPQEKFEDFLNRAGELCHVTYRSTGVEDVTEYYYDTAGRLKTQETKLERLQTLLSKAENMEDIITIESAISDTEQQIESLSGELKHYDAQIDYSAVYLSLSEVYQLSNVEQPATTFASRVGAALSSGTHGFVLFLQGVIVFLAYAWVPVLLIAALLAAGVVYGRKRRAKIGGDQKSLPKKKDDKTE